MIPEYVLPAIINTGQTLRIMYDPKHFKSYIEFNKPVATIHQVLVEFGWYPTKPGTEIVISEDPITKEKIVKRYYLASAWTGRK